jgi:hypothetical protein
MHGVDQFKKLLYKQSFIFVLQKYAEWKLETSEGFTLLQAVKTS